MAAKEQCNQLLSAALPFAEKMLREYGQFHPFGAQMLNNGEVVSVGASDGEDQPPAQSLMDLLQGAFKNGAAEGDLLATALVYDARVTPPGTDQKSDAIAVSLDHRDDYSVVVFFPYHITSGEPVLG
jgi:hypothetical protein